ncbi:hypothetical protein NEIELOOT_02285 [Neisseria elongata subsp. glycolytica ATCC 29315]|uniref:Uncharacterized protein n=1 Tax=Neisseria elongata subsp. glycolytica ATCC 29315 TaxID=546263 RepID=D4DT83_NEIEG|nr:hypothetical protein NEIELOOT_02285 [Neisseria elongata subsp. glycolytica ATCC 29315]
MCQIGDSDGFRYQNFVHDGFGGCLEGVLIRLKFEFLAFFTTAYTLVVAVTGIAVASAFAAFAFGIAALFLSFIIVMIAAFVFFTAAAARIRF